MIEQIERSADASRISPTNGTPRQELEALTDQELQQKFERLSSEIEKRKRDERPLVGLERLEWEAELLGIMYQRESIQYEQLSRSMAHLDQCWTAARARQGRCSLGGVYV
jgi:hypothetical protein